MKAANLTACLLSTILAGLPCRPSVRARGRKEKDKAKQILHDPPRLREGTPRMRELQVLMTIFGKAGTTESETPEEAQGRTSLTTLLATRGILTSREQALTTVVGTSGAELDGSIAISARGSFRDSPSVGSRTTVGRVSGVVAPAGLHLHSFKSNAASLEFKHVHVRTHLMYGRQR